MFGIILSISVITACLWASVTSSIAAYRHREIALVVLAISYAALAIYAIIPLTSLLIGGYGNSMETWLVVQIVIFLFGITGLAIYNYALGGLARLRAKGITLKQILLLRT